MEDESEEWMIEEYPSSSKETNPSRLRWILNRGFGLGKKVAIAGVVISSAPVVLPPLVVISALGFAFSVPFGLVFASYACTEKLMSKLLPSPTLPLMLEFETDTSEQEDEDDGVGFEGELVMEEGEQEQTEDLKRGVEMRIELDGPGSGEREGHDLNYRDEYWPKDVTNYEGYVGQYLENQESKELKGDELKDGYEYWRESIDDYEEEAMGVKEGRKKEEGYEEDVGKYLEEGKVEVTRVDIVVGGSDKVVGDEEQTLVATLVVEEAEDKKVKDDEEGDDIVRESIGLLQKIRDGGEVDDGVNEASGIEERDIGGERKTLEVSEEPCGEKNVKLEQHNGEVKEMGGEKRDVIVSKENEKAFEDDNMKLQDDGKKGEKSTSEQKKLNGKVKRKRGKKKGKATLDERKLNGEVKEKEGKKIDEMKLDEHEEIPGKRTEEKAENIPTTKNIVLPGKPNQDTSVVNGENIEDTNESISEGHKPDVENKSDYKYNVEGLSLEKKEIVIHQIDSAREAVEESGFDVGADIIAEGVPYPERLGENDNARDSTGEEIADFLELPVSKGGETKYSKIASETDLQMPSNEVLLSEVKLWQQIDALRAIVGYKTEHDPTFMGELKALYIFTGVEPPPSFKNPQDLAEVDEKLRFLMSVVGVK
ncbi:hypothetical protein LguiB_011394 [Lonicera macranthoides]